MFKKEELSKFDGKFEKLVELEKSIIPEGFFRTKWSTFEEVPLYSRYSQISFLKKLPIEERDLYLLRYSLIHLDKLIGFFCDNAEKEVVKNTLLYLSIQDWNTHPYNPICPSFFITYKCHDLFEPQRPFVWPYTRQSKYVIGILEKLGVRKDYWVCDDAVPIDTELQRVHIGLKRHPDSDLITLGSFIEKA